MALLRCKTCVLAIVQFAAISGTFALTKTPPYFIEEPSDTYVKKGRPAVLKCQVGGNPKPSIMWKRNGNKLDLTSDSHRMIKLDGSLYFSEIIHHKTEKPDEGTYQCEAFSQISNLDYQIASKTARLIVAGISSKVTVTPSALVRIRHRDTARLFCSVKHSAPKAVISWRKKGENETITAGVRFTLTPNGALQIRNIRFEEQGQYECIAENTVTAKKHISTNAASIEVIGDDRFDRPPSFTVKPQDTVAISGSNVVLECIANGFPKPRVTWLRDGSPVALGSGYSILGESNLLIESLSVAQAGNYTCQAKSESLKEEATARLQVHSPPVFMKKPRAAHAYQHTDVRFECSADGMPKPRITWSKTGDIITNTPFTTVGEGFLLILEVALSDMGSYQCFAENDLGRIQATTELYVYRKGDRIPTTTPAPTTTPGTTTTISTTTTPKPRVPEKPENVVAHVHSDTEIELTWAPPAVTNGKILQYMIYYNIVADGPGPIGYKTVNTSGDDLRILLSGLKPGTKYRFNVFAKNKQGGGAISVEETATTLLSSQVPGRPLNLRAEAETDSSIRVTWAEPDTGPSSVFRYVIVYKDASFISGVMKEITKQQTRLLRNLKTYTKYIISVYAENKIGKKGASAITEATTKGGVPRIPPTDFVLKPDSSGRGLIATWKAPDPTKVNGRIAFYIIKFRKVGSQVENTTAIIEADRQSYSIKGLMPSTRYEAKIAAGTDSGVGVYTRNWVKASTNVTNCEEDTTPGKPEFNFLKEFSNAILVDWKPPVNAGLVCVTGYKIEWGENSPHQFNVGPLSSDKTQYLIKGLLPNRKYVILLKAVNSNGNGPDIQAIVQTSDSKGELEPVKGVQAIPLSSKAMRLSWRDTRVSGPVLRIYHVYHALRKKLSYCGNTTERSIKCSKLRPNTKYTFYVRRNDEAINATVSNFTMEDKPGPPTDLTGDPDEKDYTRLSLHWQPPLELNGRIVKYRIYYSTNINASLKTWQAVEADGSKLTKQITQLKPGTAYYFQMQAKTAKGWGPMSEKEEVSTLTAALVSKVPAATTALSMTPAPSEPDAAAQQGAAVLKNKTLWIVIAAVAGITLIAIIIISVILCKKRSGDDIQRKPPTYKSVIQANGSAKKKHKEEKPPDLWINHTDDLEMKPVKAVNPAPDVTNTSTIPRSSEEMKPLDDSPLDHIKVDHDRSSFLNGSEADPDDFANLPPPPMIDSKGDPYPEYADETRMPTPPPSPEVSPFLPPRMATPDNVKQPIYPKTSTPRYQMSLPRTGSCENTLDVADPRPPQRSRSYDPDFRAPSSKVPVYPMLHTSPPATLPKPKPKPPVAPADDIQLPPVGYNRRTPPNGYWTPPPKYEDIFARRSNPPPSPPRDEDAVVEDLDKEIAGLEGLMRDLNEITAGDYLV